MERDLILDELKAQLQRAQEVMKKGADGKRRDIKFKAGDLVYVKLQPYRQKSLARRANEKLAARYYGPYEVEREVGPVAYKLKLPPHCHLHPVFHVSLLKEARGTPTAILDIPSQLKDDLQLLVEPEKVLEVRAGAGKGLQGIEVLV